MTLKTVTKTIHEVDSYDLEQFVAEITGVTDYSFVATEECGNDSIHDFTVKSDPAIYEMNEEDVDKWLASDGRTWITNNDILNWLCVKGHIEAGTYLVSVCW